MRSTMVRGMGDMFGPCPKTSLTCRESYIKHSFFGGIVRFQREFPRNMFRNRQGKNIEQKQQVHEGILMDLLFYKERENY